MLALSRGSGNIKVEAAATQMLSYWHWSMANLSQNKSNVAFNAVFSAVVIAFSNPTCTIHRPSDSFKCSRTMSRSVYWKSILARVTLSWSIRSRFPALNSSVQESSVLAENLGSSSICHFKFHQMLHKSNVCAVFSSRKLVMARREPTC